MRWLPLLVLCACNGIFGLSKTREIDAPPPADAQYFDAPADAPYTCPTDGTLPSYGKLLHQVVQQGCYQYTISAATGIAVATCYEPTNGPYSGRVDMPMTPIALTSQYTPYVYSLEITPEGDRLYGEIYDGVSTTYQLASFLSTGDDVWADGTVQTLPFMYAASELLSVPSRAPQRHAMYLRNDATWHELVESAPDTWTEARATPYSLADLGVTYAYEPQLSPDGLRFIAMGELVGATTYKVLYTSRATITDDFPPFRELSSVPSGGSYPFMTSDCSRVYFFGLGSVLYVQQE